MAEQSLSLRVVDGLHLSGDLRAALAPAEVLYDRQGTPRRLPRWFYEVPDFETASSVELAPYFRLREFLVTDVHEAACLQGYPRYVPCAITLLAASLSVVRQRLGSSVYIAANGGYRSPAHRMSASASPHSWGAAADIYRVGDTFLESSDSIESCAAEVRSVLPGAWIKTTGDDGELADHLHIDIGHASMIPREALDAAKSEDRV